MSLPDEVLVVNPWELRAVEELHGFEWEPNVVVTELGSHHMILESFQMFKFTWWPQAKIPEWDAKPFSESTSLGGCAIEAIAQSWGSPLKEIIHQVAKQKRNKNERVIGHVNGQEIKKDVVVLRRV